MTANAGRLGVGFLGAGPVTQAIHLPALARLADIFQVVTVMDLDAEVARAVAGRVEARPTTSISELLEDPQVEVVGICSPHQFHAEQVIAACRAGKRAVLCEKPFAMSTTEATAIAQVSADTGVPILVGAMHAYDPGWLAARDNFGDLTRTVHTIRSSIVLPPNPRFEDFATEVVSRPAPAPAAADDDAEIAAEKIRGGVMGLAIHDLPLIREFVPEFGRVRVLWSEVLRPFGYWILLECAGVSIELHALMSANWAPDWRLEIIGTDQSATVHFTPSYVQAGSATARLGRLGNATTYGPYQHNGYEGEWRHLADVVHGVPPMIDTAVLIDDLTFALRIAELAGADVRERFHDSVLV